MNNPIVYKLVKICSGKRISLFADKYNLGIEYKIGKKCFPVEGTLLFTFSALEFAQKILHARQWFPAGLDGKAGEPTAIEILECLGTIEDIENPNPYALWGIGLGVILNRKFVEGIARRIFEAKSSVSYLPLYDGTTYSKWVKPIRVIETLELE